MVTDPSRKWRLLFTFYHCTFNSTYFVVIIPCIIFYRASNYICSGNRMVCNCLAVSLRTLHTTWIIGEMSLVKVIIGGQHYHHILVVPFIFLFSFLICLSGVCPWCDVEAILILFPITGFRFWVLLEAFLVISVILRCLRFFKVWCTLSYPCTRKPLLLHNNVVYLIQ